MLETPKEFNRINRDETEANSLLNYKNGDLHFGMPGKKISELMLPYKGPTFIYDLNSVSQRVQLMKKHLPQVEIFYAMKANPNLEVLRTLLMSNVNVDVVSLGEIRRAMTAGFKSSQIVYSGVGKTIYEIEQALELNIHQINVESIPELKRIGQIASRMKKTATIALRLNPNIDIKTHPYIATGLTENKFGIELSQLSEIEKILDQEKSLSLVGVSLHLGSMMTDLSGFRTALKLLRPIYETLQRKYPTVQRFDVGGGLGIYYEKMDLLAEAELLQDYSRIIRDELDGLKGKLQTEPGRWLVAHSGILVSQVQYIKETTHKTFVILDSGMNHLVRPAFYGSHHSILPLRKPPGAAERCYDIVGPICESSDFFAKNRTIPEVGEGDLIAIADCGAYSYSMASTYNLHELPSELCLP